MAARMRFYRAQFALQGSGDAAPGYPLGGEEREGRSPLAERYPVSIYLRQKQPLQIWQLDQHAQVSQRRIAEEQHLELEKRAKEGDYADLSE